MHDVLAEAHRKVRGELPLGGAPLEGRVPPAGRSWPEEDEDGEEGIASWRHGGGRLA